MSAPTIVGPVGVIGWDLDDEAWREARKGGLGGSDISAEKIHGARLVLRRVAVSKETGCWHFTGYLNPYGYGETGKGMAHRVVYEGVVGQIPAGLFLDHTCHSGDRSCAGGNSCLHRSCVNPSHLEPVTPKENINRGRTAEYMSHRHDNTTHCVSGHPFDVGNTYVTPDGRRQCRICRRTSSREYMARRRAAAKAASA